MQEIGGALRVRGGGEDRPLVVFERFEPGADVSGVILAMPGREVEIGAQERRTKLGDQFFHGVARVTEALAPEIPLKARRVPRPVHVMPISA